MTGDEIAFIYEHETGSTQQESVAIAALSEHNSRQIEQGEHQPKYRQDFPSGTLYKCDWQTHPDLLAQGWDREQNQYYGKSDGWSL